MTLWWGYDAASLSERMHAKAEAAGPALVTFLGGVALAVIPLGAGAQQQQGGLSVDLTYSERLFHDDGDTSLRSDLDIGVTSRTRSQVLSFTARGGIEKSIDGGLDGSLEDPDLTLGYGLETRNSTLGFDLSYNRTELRTQRLEEFLDLGVFVPVVDDGERESIRAGLTLDIARDAPFGARVALDYGEIDFIDLDPDAATPSTTASGSVRFRFNLTPTSTGYLTFSLSEVDRQGGLDVRSERISASVDVQIRPGLSGTLDLGYAEITRSGSEPRSTSDGLFYGLSLVADRPNGTLSGLLDRTIEETGKRTTLQVNRNFVLPRGGLSAGLGLSRRDDVSGTDPLYNLAYSHQTARSALQLTFGQSFATTSAGNETLNTDLGLALSRDFGELADLNASIQFSDNNALSSGAADSDRFELTVDYSRTLSRNWDAFAGFSHILRRQDGRDDNEDNQVYLGIRTSLGWRP